MESGSLPIIQNAVPEKIYGGYAPQSLYKETASDSGFYNLFIRQLNGPEAAEGAVSEPAPEARRAAKKAETEAMQEATDRAETKARQEATDRAVKTETDAAESSKEKAERAAKEAEVREGAGSGAAEEESAKADVSEERGLKDDADDSLENGREAGKEKFENIKTAVGESQIKSSRSTEGETAKKLQHGEMVKAAADKEQNNVSEKNHTEILPEKKEKKKPGSTGEEIVNPGVIEINVAGKDRGAGEKKVQASDRKIKEKAELLKTEGAGKGRVVIEDRRSVKSLDKNGTNAEWKKDGGNTDKQNTELRNTVKDELLDKNEKIIKIGNEQLGKLQDNPQNGRALTSGRSAGQPHGSELLRQLKESGNRQIAKHTGIILKDNNSGEIKLVLKPENLGNVRIRLQLNENSITGKVLVENQMVRAAFEQNLEALYKAFKESGFESASLDVQVGGEAGHGKGKNEGGEPGYATKKIKFLEEQIPLTKAGNFADTIIDLVV